MKSALLGYDVEMIPAPAFPYTEKENVTDGEALGLNTIPDGDKVNP